MMGNKWVQSSIIFGIACGIWLGGWIAALIDPVASLVVPIPVFIFGTLVLNKARGTDGWGGPYNGGPSVKNEGTSK